MASTSRHLCGRLFDLVLIVVTLVVAVPLLVTIFGAVRAAVEAFHEHTL